MMATEQQQHVKVFLSVDIAIGLVADAWAELTEDSIEAFAPTAGRGRGSGFQCFARVVERQDGPLSIDTYLSDAERSDKALHHACVKAVDLVVNRHIINAKQVQLAETWRNVVRWVRIRDFQPATATGLLGAGWWRRTDQTTANLRDLAALLRLLDKVARMSPDREHNSQEEVDLR